MQATLWTLQTTNGVENRIVVRLIIEKEMYEHLVRYL